MLKDTHTSNALYDSLCKGSRSVHMLRRKSLVSTDAVRNYLLDSLNIDKNLTQHKII